MNLDTSYIVNQTTLTKNFSSWMHKAQHWATSAHVFQWRFLGEPPVHSHNIGLDVKRRRSHTCALRLKYRSGHLSHFRWRGVTCRGARILKTFAKLLFSQSILRHALVKAWLGADFRGVCRSHAARYNSPHCLCVSRMPRKVREVLWSSSPLRS